MFRKQGLKYELYHQKRRKSAYNLVYGGGGGFVPFWGNLPRLQSLLTDGRVKRCVILPHSFYQADELVRSLDARFTVFCREERSLAYCRSLNSEATFILADDMALSLQKEELPPPGLLDEVGFLHHQFLRVWGRLSERKRQASIRMWNRKRYNRGFHDELLNRASVCVRQDQGLKIGCFMRKDEERQAVVSPKANFDLSLQWVDDCCDEQLSYQLIRSFLAVIDMVDVVITDRLHVGIGAHLMGKKIYMLDNNYGKLSSIHDLSLKQNPDICMVRDWEEIPVSLREAVC